MTNKKIFTKPFTQQESIPEAGIEAAIKVMSSGRLHRYNTLPDEQSETDLLEIEFVKQDQKLLWLCFFIAFSAKIPIFPLHI